MNNKVVDQTACMQQSQVVVVVVFVGVPVVVVITVVEARISIGFFVCSLCNHLSDIPVRYLKLHIL